jgi:uncharacterized membrane protein
MTELLQELIKFLQQASPFIWQALVRQVYVDAAGNIAWAGMLIFLAVVTAKCAQWCYKKHKEDRFADWDVYLAISATFGVAAALIVFALLVCAMQQLANPEYYAIQYILRQIGGG